MLVIAIINHKGGVGKTTTTVNLGAALQELGKKVLLVDFDPQASLTVHLGIKRPETLPASCGHALLSAVNGDESPTFREILLQTPAGLDLVPTGRQLAEAEPLLGKTTDWAFALRNCLAPLRDAYDYILIDSPPSQTYLAYNAMAAADAILVPTQTDYLAVQGLESTFQTALFTQQRFNPSLCVLGILLTMVDPRTKHSRWVVGAVRRSFEGKVRVFETMIGLQVSFKESSKDGVSVLRYRAASLSAMAYRNLAREVIAAAEAPISVGEARAMTGLEAPTEVTKVALREAKSLAQDTSIHVPATSTATVQRPAASPVAPATPSLPKANGQAPVSTATNMVAESRPAVNWGPHVCPFLALAEDQTTQLNRPDAAHRCWAAGTPSFVDIEWQHTVCQQRWYWSCGRYGSNAFGAKNTETSLVSRVASWLHLRR